MFPNFPTGLDMAVACREQLPDAALIDIGIPEMDGFELAVLIRALEGKAVGTPVLAAMTGRIGSTYEARATACGFDLFFRKPIEIRQICQHLFSRLEQQSLVVQVA